MIPQPVREIERGLGQADGIQPEAGRTTEVPDGRVAAELTVDLGAQPGDLGSTLVLGGLAIGALQQPAACSTSPDLR